MKLTADEFLDLEVVLFFFHTKCATAVAALPLEERRSFLANVDIVASDAFVKAALAKQLPAKKTYGHRSCDVLGTLPGGRGAC